jgi:hypothetical protein
MRRTVSILYGEVLVVMATAAIIALWAIVGAAPALADHQAGATTTVSGEVIDLACYFHGGTGADHAPCAQRCARMGQPLGLLAGDGKVYLLLADHADQTAFGKLKELAGKKAEIKGETQSKDGLNGLTVQSVKAL